MQLINGVYYFSRESDSAEGFAARPPKGYTPDKRYPVLVLVPGMGDRSQGTTADLINVIDGYDYDGAGPLPRQWAVETPQFEAMIEQFQFIGVTVTYPSEFNPNDLNYVLDTLEKYFSIDTSREAAIGFSLGGGSILRYITSSLSNAKRLSFAAAAAPVNWATVTKNVVDAGLQFIGTTYETDPVVSASNVKNFVSAISNTVPKPVLIIYPGNAHGGFNELINNPAIYEYLVKTSRDNRIQFVVGGTIITPPVEPPTTTVKAITSYMITGNKIALSGRNSTGYNIGYDGVWAFKSGPAGVTAKQVFPTGSSYIDANGILPVAGTYVFTFTLKGAAPVDLTVVYGTASIKEMREFSSSTDMIIYTDGSTEGATAKYVNGKWTVTTESGLIF